MERRVILAFILMLIVLVLPGILFPPKKTANRRALKDSISGGQAVGDTSRAADTARTPPPAALTAVASPFVCPAATDRESSRARSSGVAAETVWVSSPRARFGFSTAGAQLLSAELLDYKSFAPGDAERPVQLVPADGPLLAHCLVVGGDTISLADWRFTPSVPALRVERDSVPLTLTAERGAARVVLTYVFVTDQYRFQVRGHVTGLGSAGAVLLVGMGHGLRSVEAGLALPGHGEPWTAGAGEAVRLARATGST